MSVENEQNWLNWLHDFPMLQAFVTRRISVPVRYIVHHFCDASHNDYGTVSYPRLV